MPRKACPGQQALAYYKHLLTANIKALDSAANIMKHLSSLLRVVKNKLECPCQKIYVQYNIWTQGQEPTHRVGHCYVLHYKMFRL